MVAIWELRRRVTRPPSVTLSRGADSGLRAFELAHRRPAIVKGKFREALKNAGEIFKCSEAAERVSAEKERYFACRIGSKQRLALQVRGTNACAPLLESRVAEMIHPALHSASRRSSSGAGSEQS